MNSKHLRTDAGDAMAVLSPPPTVSPTLGMTHFCTSSFGGFVALSERNISIHPQIVISREIHSEVREGGETTKIYGYPNKEFYRPVNADKVACACVLNEWHIKQQKKQMAPSFRRHWGKRKEPFTSSVPLDVDSAMTTTTAMLQRRCKTGAAPCVFATRDGRENREIFIAAYQP